MFDIRRISNSRWWHKKKNWILFVIFLFLVFVRISKGSLYKDLYYFISKPFWPGQFQKEVILKSSDQESLVKINLLEEVFLSSLLLFLTKALKYFLICQKNTEKNMIVVFIFQLISFELIVWISLPSQSLSFLAHFIQIILLIHWKQNL